MHLNGISAWDSKVHCVVEKQYCPFTGCKLRKISFYSRLKSTSHVITQLKLQTRLDSLSCFNHKTSYMHRNLKDCLRTPSAYLQGKSIMRDIILILFSTVPPRPPQPGTFKSENLPEKRFE